MERGQSNATTLNVIAVNLTTLDFPIGYTDLPKAAALVICGHHTAQTTDVHVEGTVGN